MNYLPIEPSQVNGELDFVLISPEAYVDHPSFGHSIIARIIQAEGFNIAINVQPKKDLDFTKFGMPKIGFLVSGGVVDSMVNNYTVAKQRRSKDEYSHGGQSGLRPDRAVTVYTKALKRLYPNSPVIIGGIEASLRRFAHYDYWADKILPSILVDSGADLLIYGMGERPLWDILSLVKRGVPLDNIKDVNGTAYLTDFDNLSSAHKSNFADGTFAFCPSFEEIVKDKIAYTKAYKLQYANSNPISGKGVVQKHNNKYVISNPPQISLTQSEMDRVYNLPFVGDIHPSYDKGVPAIEEVKFSITSHRGCFGSCSYCALSYHQGRAISHRSEKSIVQEAIKLSNKPDFKGYIHDIGGPTANFRNPSCAKQETKGVCKDKQCIGFEVCPNLKVDHTDYLNILRQVRALPKIKKVFIRSGVRFDYVMYDKNNEFFDELVAHHVSGQLKVAPEHNSLKVLKSMNKPNFDIYKEFYSRFMKKTKELGKEQYIVPYLISSHPTCSLTDASGLTDYLMSIGYMPEQVQDFYPTPSTRSTCMYYTELDIDTLEPIYVAKTPKDKSIQRAFLQYRLPHNKIIIAEALQTLKPKTVAPVIKRKNFNGNKNSRSH